MISRIWGLPNSGTMRPRRGKAATFSASRMILEPTFSAADGLSLEINWPISCKSATAGSVQIRLGITTSFQSAHILAAISDQLFTGPANNSIVSARNELSLGLYDQKSHTGAEKTLGRGNPRLRPKWSKFA